MGREVTLTRGAAEAEEKDEREAEGQGEGHCGPEPSGRTGVGLRMGLLLCCSVALSRCCSGYGVEVLGSCGLAWFEGGVVGWVERRLDTSIWCHGNPSVHA